MKNLVVFTGAGISAESGLQTFRDADGLWMGYNVYEVATPEGWKTNRNLVQDFYNQRRREVKKAQPNKAHKIIAQLQKDYHVQVITQNIDDLHERAGSENVIHLHGEIFKMKSDKDESLIYPVLDDIAVDAKAPDGGYLRPYVVWFGEAVPEMETAIAVLPDADIFVVVGTSLQVYPAAGILNYLSPGIPGFLIDKNPPDMQNSKGFKIIAKPATEGMEELLKHL